MAGVFLWKLIEESEQIMYYCVKLGFMIRIVEWL